MLHKNGANFQRCSHIRRGDRVGGNGITGPGLPIAGTPPSGRVSTALPFHLTRNAMTTLPAAKQPLALHAANSGGSCPLTPRAMAKECRIQ